MPVRNQVHHTDNFAINYNGASPDYQSGVGVLALKSASAVPSGTPSGEGLIYIDGSGNLQYLGPSGSAVQLDSAAVSLAGPFDETTNGLETAPSYSFANATDSGMFLAVDTENSRAVAFAVDDTEALRVAKVDGGSQLVTVTGDLAVTGVSQVPDGAVGAPTYSFTTADNTGLYLAASGVDSDSIGFAVDGTQAMTIAKTGASSTAVTINGDLTVNGASTTVTANDLIVTDRTIQANNGNSTAGAGGPGGGAEAGFEVLASAETAGTLYYYSNATPADGYWQSSHHVSTRGKEFRANDDGSTADGTQGLVVKNDGGTAGDGKFVFNDSGGTGAWGISHPLSVTGDISSTTLTVGNVLVDNFDNVDGLASLQLANNAGAGLGIYANDGSMANPSYAFASAQQFGMYYSSGDSWIGFASADSDLLRIENTSGLNGANVKALVNLETEGILISNGTVYGENNGRQITYTITKTLAKNATPSQQTVWQLTSTATHSFMIKARGIATHDNVGGTDGDIANITDPVGDVHVITTTDAHELADGDQVEISGSTNVADGIYTITVTSTTSFSLDGTTGDGDPDEVNVGNYRQVDGEMVFEYTGIVHSNDTTLTLNPLSSSGDLDNDHWNVLLGASSANFSITLKNRAAFTTEYVLIVEMLDYKGEVVNESVTISDTPQAYVA